MRGALLLALGLALAGCAKKKEKQPAAANPTGLTEVEVQRAKEACADYQARVCDAATKAPERPELAEACRLAPSASDAMRTALEISAHPESAPRDVKQAQDALRKTMRHCVEELAKLPQ